MKGRGHEDEVRLLRVNSEVELCGLDRVCVCRERVMQEKKL